MSRRRRFLAILTPLCLLVLAGFQNFAQTDSAGQYASNLLSGLEWRDVGPMRGGRSYGVAGHASQPDTFYSGSVGGGVWKTENAGRTWFPISDDRHSDRLDRRDCRGSVERRTSSTSARASPISAASIPTASACSNRWTRARRGRISAWKRRVRSGAWWSIPRECESRLCCRAGPRVRRRTRSGACIARSTAARRGRKFCSRPNDPNNVGAIEVAIDPKNSRVLYASLWGTRRPPWSVYAPSNMPGGGLYKSTDGGDTWKQLTGGLADRRFRGQDRHRGFAQQSEPAVGGGG